jgi:hypothetical protein
MVVSSYSFLMFLLSPMTSPPCSFDLFSRVSNFCKPCLECIASRGPPPASFSSAKAAQGEDETRDEGKGDVVVPAVNQLQFHAGMPGSDPKGLVSYSVSRGIAVQAYSPLGGDAHKALLGAPALVSIAAAHNATTAQVALVWVLQLGHALATSTVDPAYMDEDLAAWRAGWRLTKAEMATLESLDVAPDDPVKSMCLFD